MLIIPNVTFVLNSSVNFNKNTLRHGKGETFLLIAVLVATSILLNFQIKMEKKLQDSYSSHVPSNFSVFSLIQHFSCKSTYPWVDGNCLSALLQP